jgi:hypothetical protein
VVDVASDDLATDGGTAVLASSMLSGATTDTEGVRATWADVDEFTRPNASTTDFKYWHRKFTFVLKNPAAGDDSSKEQMAPSVSVTASFKKEGYTWAWTERDTNATRPDYTEYYSGLLTSAASGTAFSKDPNMYGRFNMTRTESPGYVYRDAATTPYVDQGAPYTWTQVYVAGKPAGFQNYPQYMMPLRFEAFVGQSSPFPCDNNTLTLFVQTNVPLLKACTPQLTLSGLTGSSTVANTGDGASGFGVKFHVTPGYSNGPTWAETWPQCPRRAAARASHTQCRVARAAWYSTWHRCSPMSPSRTAPISMRKGWIATMPSRTPPWTSSTSPLC